MDFIEVFVETTSQAIEIVSGLIYQAGITGIMIDDENDFNEFLNDPNREWDYIEDELLEKKTKSKTGITFFVSDNINGRETLLKLKSDILTLKETENEFDLGSLNLSLKNVKEEDWANNWKKYFKPLPVGKKIIIKPSWEELKEKTDKIILKIDPGHIFGTGTHETTKLCIEFIEDYVKKNDTVLDIGCGSGILSIASMLMGAKSAKALDIDPNAVEIATENAKMNNINLSDYKVYSGNILEDENLKNMFCGKNFDVVEANIVADVIIALSRIVPKFIKKDGIFITSGIIKDRLSDVYSALKEQGFLHIETKTEKDWAAIVFKFIG